MWREKRIVYGRCTDQVIGYDDVDKRKVGGQKVNIVAVCRSGVLHVHNRLSPRRVTIREKDIA